MRSFGLTLDLSLEALPRNGLNVKAIGEATVVPVLGNLLLCWSLGMG